MRDSDIVAAIVASDPAGLAEAYDKYAGPLYIYCKSVLRDHADAADAVQDTFVIAASRLAGLQDRERLRPWLYAVARNECRRRIRAREGIVPLDEAAVMTDQNSDVGGDAERAELRALLRDAVRGLNPAEQEVIELQLRQGLDGTEVADILGVTRNHAHALISRARDQLEVCLGVLLVARSGRHSRHDCAALNALLEDWDGELTVLLRKRLNRHIERCPICTDSRRRVLRPTTLLGLAPLAALPLSAGAPPGLREQVLRMAASSRPEAVAHRASVAGRTGAFGQHGFPKPIDPPRVRWLHARSTHIGAGAVAVAGVAATVVAVGGLHHPPGTVTAGGPSLQVSTAATASPIAATSPVANTVRSRGGGTQSQGQSPSPSGVVVVMPTSGTKTSSAAATSKPPSPSPSQSASPTPAPATSSAAVPGTLSVSPTSVLLSPLLGGSVTITAVGGPVAWWAAVSSSLAGHMTVSPASGTLQAGQQATITIAVSGLASVDTTITINPGAHAVTVTLGLL